MPVKRDWRGAVTISSVAASGVLVLILLVMMMRETEGKSRRTLDSIT